MKARISFAVTFAAVALGPGVEAHHLAAPKVDLVHVSRGEIRVMVDYAIDPAKAGELRANFDLDRDGAIAGAERVAAENWLRASATHFLAVALDGARVPLRETEAEFRGLDGSGDAGALIVLAAPVALSSGTHALVLSDRHKDAEVEVPVRVTFARGLDSSAPDAPQVLGPQARSLAIDFLAQ